MFEYVFLGTSASAPSIHRGLTSQVVMYQEHRFLIDAGEGTQRQILRSGLGFRRFDKIFITHGHLDHILGLAGLMSTFMRWETIDQLELWAPNSAMGRIRDLLFRVALPGGEGHFPIVLRALEPGRLMETDTFSVKTFRVPHRGTECFGFTFEERTRRPFLADKAAELGLPAGPERRDLVNGLPVTLADGRVIQPDAVLGEATPGTKLVHVGDAGDTRPLRQHTQQADALVIEATYLDPEREMAMQYGHLTAKQAAELARETEVHTLYLTHISRRYHEQDILREAQAVFPNTVVARDFSTFKVQRGKTTADPPDDR